MRPSRGWKYHIAGYEVSKTTVCALCSSSASDHLSLPHVLIILLDISTSGDKTEHTASREPWFIQEMPSAEFV